MSGMPEARDRLSGFWVDLTKSVRQRAEIRPPNAYQFSRREKNFSSQKKLSFFFTGVISLVVFIYEQEVYGYVVTQPTERQERCDGVLEGRADSDGTISLYL